MMIPIDRRDMIAGACLLMALGPLASGAGAQARTDAVATPLDHEQPELGHFEQSYELIRCGLPGAPTVVVVADGQQFYTRPGAAERLREDLFGPHFDILVPYGRGRNPALHERLTGAGAIDWTVAHRLLKRDQWIADLEHLVRHLGLRDRPLYLYGRSGGAHLVYEWLVSRPDAADRAYVQAAVNPELDVRWGLGADRTWDDLSASAPGLAADLMARLARQPADRPAIVRLLQRQNFFVPLDEIGAERIALVTAFLENDEPRLADYRRSYQIDALDALAGTIEGIAATVRLFEFAAPRQDPRATRDRLFPDVELLFDQAQPLIALAKAGTIASPLRDWSRLAAQKAEVLQIAGRYDHTADYRTQIGLEAAVPEGRLLIFADDHRLSRFAGSGRQSGLLQAFFAGGASSPAFAEAVEAVGSLLWREQS